MAKFYSRSRRGFYDDTVQAIPADGLPVTDAAYAQLLTDQANGAQILPTAEGAPYARFPTAAEKRERLAAATRAEASRRISAVAPLWKQLNDLRSQTPEGDQRFASIDSIRAASDQIETDIGATSEANLDTFDISTNVHWP